MLRARPAGRAARSWGWARACRDGWDSMWVAGACPKAVTDGDVHYRPQPGSCTMPDRPAATPFSADPRSAARAPGVPQGRARRRSRGRVPACGLHDRASGAARGARFHRHPAFLGRCDQDRTRVRSDRALPLGRPGRDPGQHAGVPDGRIQHRRRAGSAGRHAPRRDVVLSTAAGVGGVGARAARDEPRVPRRRAAASRRPPDVERGEGAESPGLGRRVGDRGAARRARAGRSCGRRAYARRITAYTPCAISGPAAGATR